MTKTIQTTLGASLLLGLGLAGGLGCGTDKSSARDFFPADGQDRVSTFRNSQSTIGSRDDAMLYPHHFDGDKLNSLGTEKLARLVPDEPSGNLVVYLNLEGDEMTTARREAVSAYLSAAGVDAAHLKLEAGANPHENTPAGPGQAALAKMDGSAAEAPSTATKLGEAMMEMTGKK